MRTINRSKIAEKKPKKSIFLRILFYFSLLIFFGVLFYTVFFSPALKILSINIRGNNYIEEKLILEKINFEISGKYFNKLDKNNLILIKTRKIEKYFIENFKIIKKIKISRKFPHDLEINILERIPQIIFCGKDKCFFLDEFGETYDYTDPESSEKKSRDFLILNDESGKEFNLSEIILEKDYMDYVLGIKNNISEVFNLEIERKLRTPSLISEDIRVKTKEGWEIYFNKKIELEKEFEALKLVLENKIPQEKRKDLEYIDLRINNKIYYRFKEGIQEELNKQEEAVQGKETVGKEEKKKRNKK